jgi:hypothetical protein
MSNEIRVEVEGIAYLVGPRVESGKFGTPDHVEFRREGQPGSYRLAHADSPLYTLNRQIWQARYEHDRAEAAEAPKLTFEVAPSYAAILSEAAVAAAPKAAEPEPRTAEVVGAPDTELARRVLDLLDRGGTVDDVRRMVTPAAAAVTEVRVLMDSHVGGEASFVAPDGVRVTGTVYHICGLWQVLGSRRTVHPDLSGTLNLWARQNGVQGGLSVSLVRPEQD